MYDSGDIPSGTPGRMEIQKLLLEKVKITAQRYLADRAFMRNHLIATARLDEVAQVLVVQLDSALAGHKTARIDIEKRWPEDWWQGVRERWFPKWWLRRWPVKYKTVSIHKAIYNVCPHLDVKMERDHLEFLTQVIKPVKE